MNGQECYRLVIRLVRAFACKRAQVTLAQNLVKLVVGYDNELWAEGEKHRTVLFRELKQGKLPTFSQ